MDRSSAAARSGKSMLRSKQLDTPAVRSWGQSEADATSSLGYASIGSPFVNAANVCPPSVDLIDSGPGLGAKSNPTMYTTLASVGSQATSNTAMGGDVRGIQCRPASVDLKRWGKKTHAKCNSVGAILHDVDVVDVLVQTAHVGRAPRRATIGGTPDGRLVRDPIVAGR